MHVRVTCMLIAETSHVHQHVRDWSLCMLCIPVNPPPLRGSLPRKSLISRMDWVSCTGDINLPHNLSPTKNFSPDFEGPFLPSCQLSKSSAREQNQVQ